MTRRQIDLPEEHAEVFIAHINQTLPNAVAHRLLQLLADRGLTCFLDMRDLSTGVSYIRPIVASIRQARVVVVLFGEAPSAWVQFEAGCAFADEKLMPVSIGAAVPAPYDRIQLEKVVPSGLGRTATEADIDMAALGRVADEIKHRVHGRPADTAATLRWRQCNALFFSGLPILAGLVFALLLLRGESLVTQHLRHLHVVLGAAVVGGQFFLALAFARVMASPSFRQREFGFDTIERLFGVWLWLALLQPVLGLWFGWRLHAQVLPHVWCALALYLVALLLSLGGYVAAGSARRRDADHAAPRRVAARHLQANLLFLAGFAVMAAVVNLMLTRQLPWQVPTPPALAPAVAVIQADEAVAISALPPAR